jgi:Carboxypeptidase regulatory-like domain/TonB dependent receptor
MNPIFNRLAFTAVALVAGAGLQAQSTITLGSISGKVTDNNGAPIAGARVLLTSNQTTRNAVTATDGTYRAGLLNPGAWEVRVIKEQFQTQTGNVMVSPSDNRAVNFKLVPIADATVVVFGSNTVLDTTSISLGQSLTMDQIASIPTTRDFSGVALFSPGVVSNGGFNVNSPSMSGASGAENSYYVDGLNTTDNRYGFQGAALKVDFIDQVAIQTGGFAPEFSALGGVFNAITKSGSNEFKGSAWTTWDAVGIHAVLKKNAYFQEPNLNVDNRYDAGAMVSGPIIKDKLFFMAGFDYQSQKGIATSQVDPVIANAQPTTDAIQTVFKVNWFLTTDMQLTWFGNYNNTKLDTGRTGNFGPYGNNFAGFGSIYGSGQSGFTQTDKTTSTNLSFDWNITPALSLSVKGGFFQLETTQNPYDTADNQTLDYYWYAPGGPGANPAYNGNPYAAGGFGVWTQEEKDKTTQFNAALTWIAGTHAVKFGGGYLKSDYTLAQQGSGAGGFQYQINDATSMNAILFLNLPATVSATYTSLFAQDNWEALPGFRLIYGARWEGQTQDGYNGVQIFSFSNLSDGLQPRFGFTWDVNNDGKTKVSGSWARYFEHFPQRAAIRTWGRETYISQNYDATDFLYTPNTPTHVTITGAPVSTTDYSTAFNQDPIAQGIKMPQRDEVALGVDHTFASGWTLGIHGLHRELKDAIEDSVILGPGGAPISADGHAIWWNPGPSVTWTQTSASSDAGTTYNVTNTGFPPAKNTYDAVTLTADYRSDRDYFSCNYTWSRLQGNYEGVISSAGGLQADGNITASYDSFAYVGYGLLPLDRTNVLKVQYSHRFTFQPGDLNVGFNYSYISGTPISLFDDGSTSQGKAPGTLGAGNYPGDPLGYGNSTPANGEYGQYGRTPFNQQVDMHTDFQYNLGGKMRLAPSIDIFNLFNSRAATGVQQTATLQFSGAPDSRYGVETGWMEGRRFRFGVKFTF